MKKERRMGSKMLADFKIIKREHRLLKKLEGDDYFNHVEIFKTLLIKFLSNYSGNNKTKELIIHLPKPDFLILCSMVSKYRPIGPWRFLSDVDVMVEL